MVSATDHDPVVIITQVGETKTHRLACSDCDWMETAGSAGAATRKKNSHLAEHRSSTTGAPGVPTIMDAIEGEVEMPAESFREAVPVVPASEEPVLVKEVVKDFMKLGEQGGSFTIAKESATCQWCGELHEGGPEHCSVRSDLGNDDPDRTKDLDGEPTMVEETIADLNAQMARAVVEVPGPIFGTGHVPTPEERARMMLRQAGHEISEDPPREWTEVPDGGPSAEWTEPVNTTPNPQGWGTPKDGVDLEKRLDHCPPHTKSIFEPNGFHICLECSNEIQDYVEWPCPYVAERQEVIPPGVPPLAVALTRSRIEAQAGPSDADKDDPDSLWHAARAKAVSATLAAKLGSAYDVAYIIEREVRERLNDARFRGNSYTRWGREREPYLEQVGLERYGIVGEDRLFHHRENPRHVCSPDGIVIHPEDGRVGLGEYKTSGKELTLAKAGANGYIDQIQWQMYVMEADWAVLIWEYRDGEKANYDSFRPFNGGEHFIMRDEARIAELVRRADAFLARLDEEQAKMDEWTSRQVIDPAEQIDPHLQWLVHQHLEAKQRVTEAEVELREYLDANGIKTLEMPGDWKISYSFGSPRKTFDKEAFEEAYPGVYDTFLREGATPERATLRVTPARSEDAP